MSSSVLIAIVAVVAVALLGLLMRRASDATQGATAPGAAPEAPIEPDETIDDDESDESVAISSDGWSFVPVGDRDKVQLVPPRVPDELARETGPARIEQLGRGDLIAARVVRGAPDHDPWRLEALGRDHEYRAWRFETEEAARAALALVTGRVVRTARDDDGEPIAVVDDDYAAARRQEEEIEAELASMPEPGDRPGEPIG